MEILLFKFSKKSYSTKTPNDSTGVAVHVDVKQNVMGGREGFSKDCFAVTPTFFITSGLTPDKATCYNYCKAFGRYYFIRNAMVDITNAITLFCEVDALATLKNEILNTSARVLYSTSHGSLQIDDKRNGPAANTVVDWEIEELFPRSLGGGSYVLNVIGRHDANIDPGATPFSVSYLIENISQASAFADAMLDSNVLQSLARWWNNTQNFVVSLCWTPIELPTNLAGSDVNIFVGDVDTQVQAKPFKVRYYSISNIPLSVPHRYTDYRQSSKYVDYTLNIPFCGSMRIPVSLLKNETEIYITPVLDLMTGDVAVRITNDNNAIIGLLAGNAYSELPLAVETGIGKNALGVVGAAAAAGAAVVTGGATLATAAEAGTAVAEATRTAVGVAHLANAAQTMLGAIAHEQTELCRGGALSSAVGGLALPTIELVENAHDSIYSPNELKSLRGLPYGKIALIGDLSGYCQTEGAIIESDDYSEIIYIANKQMDAGFYIE